MLEVKDLRVYIGPLYILQGVSFVVNKGETLFLIGRNGAGKTTLIKALAGFIKPSTGYIGLDGVDITYEPPYIRARLGMRYVPDNRRLFHSLSVEENLLVPLLSEGIPKEKALERVEHIYNIFPDLKRLRKLRASHLSGGQQQMLNIARAIASPSAKILLVDEPIEGLSPLYASRIVETLSILAEEGVSMVIVETKPQLMAKLGGRYVVLSAGRVAAEGTVEDLIEKKHILEIYLGISHNPHNPGG